MARANVPHVISDDSALGGQLIGGSLRFDKASGDHFLSRTPSSASNQKTYTFSCWYKRSSITYSLANVLEQKNNGQNYAVMFFRDDDKLEFHGYTSTGGNQYTHRLVSSQVFRDTNAWYHIVVAVDTTQSTASNRVKIYVNGSQITDFDVIVNPSQNFNTFFNSTQLVTIGRGQADSSQCYDGYMTEINFADGLQLEPSYFGYTDSQTGTWRPKKYKAPSVDNHFNWPLNNTHIDILNGTAFSENNGSPSFVSAGSNSFGLTNCLDIAGDGKYLSYAITPASQWTIDFYVKLDNQTGANSYIGGWNGTGGSNCCVGVNKDNAPNYYFVVWGGGGNLYQTNVTVSLNTWYHIRMTTNATNDLKLYVNGTLVATDTSSNENPVTPLTFGDMQSGRFNGQIAGVRYITRDLGAPPSGGLVSTNGVLPNVDSIIKYGANGFNLPLDGSNNITKDMSGNGNNFLSNAISGTVPIGKATGAFPILNTNTGATVAHSGLRSDPFASNIIFATTFSESGIVASDVHHLVKGSGSAKSITISGATNNNAHHNFYGRSGSAYFDGSNDYMTVPDNDDWNYGSGDFCIECWVKPTNLSGSRRIISHDENDDNPDSSWILRTDGDKLNFYFQCNGSSSRIYLNNGVRPLSTNEWYHVAVTRQGSTFRTFINGQIDQTGTFSGTLLNITDAVQIGRRANGSEFWSGYMQDLRVYKGVAKYTEEFLCGAIDPSVLEDTPSGIAISRKLDTNTGGSVALHTTANVSPDIIIASNNDLYLDGDFTIEFWIYLNSVESDTHNPSIITFPDNSGIGQVYINSTYKFISLWWPSSDIVKTVDHGVQIGKWQYITITRSSNSCRIFVDGVLGGSGYTGSHATATSSQAFGNSYGGFRIGGYTQNTGNVDGDRKSTRLNSSH